MTVLPFSRLPGPAARPTPPLTQVPATTSKEALGILDFAFPERGQTDAHGLLMLSPADYSSMSKYFAVYGLRYPWTVEATRAFDTWQYLRKTYRPHLRAMLKGDSPPHGALLPLELWYLTAILEPNVKLARRLAPRVLPFELMKPFFA
jgi:hypothetical protein